MKEVTEIKVGQVWVTKESKEPVTIHEIGDYWVTWQWFEKNGAIKYSEDGLATFNNIFEFVADSMNEEDFKQWCMTGKNPAKAVEDLKKAAWYIQDEIKRIKGEA